MEENRIKLLQEIKNIEGEMVDFKESVAAEINRRERKKNDF